MRYLFIGEKRSKKAVQMGVRWEDGRLAAKQLFDALSYCGINVKDCKFVNLFEGLLEQGILCEDHKHYIQYCTKQGYTVVGMGNEVSKQLSKMQVQHVKIVHPAALGKIRKKQNYFAHISLKLS